MSDRAISRHSTRPAPTGMPAQVCVGGLAEPGLFASRGPPAGRRGAARRGVLPVGCARPARGGRHGPQADPNQLQVSGPAGRLACGANRELAGAQCRARALGGGQEREGAGCQGVPTSAARGWMCRPPGLRRRPGACRRPLRCQDSPWCQKRGRDELCVSPLPAPAEFMWRIATECCCDDNALLSQACIVLWITTTQGSCLVLHLNDRSAGNIV